jgi:hypothetical protein
MFNFHRNAKENGRRWHLFMSSHFFQWGYFSLKWKSKSP